MEGKNITNKQSKTKSPSLKAQWVFKASPYTERRYEEQGLLVKNQNCFHWTHSDFCYLPYLPISKPIHVAQTHSQNIVTIIFHKIEDMHTLWPRISNPGCIPKGNEEAHVKIYLWHYL